MNTDPFQILGLPAHFTIDMDEAAKRHRDLSRALHPDRYVGRPSSERRMALSRAIEVNEAWRVINDPVRRAEALLARAGIPQSETGAKPANPSFLMEVMELQETLSDARSAKDLSALTQLERQLQRRQQSLIETVAGVLDDEARNPADAVQPLGELRFIRRMLHDIATAQEELL